MISTTPPSLNVPQNGGHDSNRNGGKDPTLTLDDVRKVAHLARLAISEGQLPHLRGELQSILEWVGILQQVPVDGIEPLFSPHDMSLRLLADEVTTDIDGLDDLFRNAPDAKSSFFVVPKVVE